MLLKIIGLQTFRPDLHDLAVTVEHAKTEHTILIGHDDQIFAFCGISRSSFTEGINRRSHLAAQASEISWVTSKYFFALVIWSSHHFTESRS